MKITWLKSWPEQVAELQAWHLWFAWFPVKVGAGDYRWLETVERKGTYWAAWLDGGFQWQYKAKEAA